jgi:hypothetical protein
MDVDIGTKTFVAKVGTQHCYKFQVSFELFLCAALLTASVFEDWFSPSKQVVKTRNLCWLHLLSANELHLPIGLLKLCLLRTLILSIEELPLQD